MGALQYFLTAQRSIWISFFFIDKRESQVSLLAHSTWKWSNSKIIKIISNVFFRSYIYLCTYMFKKEQLKDSLVQNLAAGTCPPPPTTLWIDNSFPADLYKRWLLAAGPACPLTVLWVNPPDSHCSIMAHLSGRGHRQQLSHSLQIKSMSDPSWASCLQGSFGSVRTTLWGIY